MEKQTKPPGPPCPIWKYTLFGFKETKKSIQARKDYEIFMDGWRSGFYAGAELRKKTIDNVFGIIKKLIGR